MKKVLIGIADGPDLSERDLFSVVQSQDFGAQFPYLSRERDTRMATAPFNIELCIFTISTQE